MEPYLEKAVRTGRLIVPSKLGAIPEEAYGMQLSELSLAGNMLKSLDPRLGNLVDLLTLNLSLNGLEDLPAELGAMSKLISLNLNDNRLKILPDVAVSFTSLRQLDVSNNSLVALPEGILALQQLTELNVAGNKLKELPKAGSTTMAALTQLTTLNLSRNKFKRVTSELSKLENLTEIDMSENRFVGWPKALNNMTNLSRVYLTANSIVGLEDMAGIGVGCLCALEELSLDMNQIAEVPEDIGRLRGLTELSLSDNDSLAYLPRGIMQCTALETLEIDGTEISPSSMDPDVLSFLKGKDMIDLSDEEV